MSTTAEEGSFPAVAIVGMGKCGTNALAEALSRFNMIEPPVWGSWSAMDELKRYGFTGEVNWACPEFMTKQGLANYKRHFSPPGEKWLDRSTTEYLCAKEMGSRLPSTTKFFVMMCDPVEAVWSRMNHLRAENTKSSNTDELMYTVSTRLNSTRECGYLVQNDPRLAKQHEVCYTLEAGLTYGDVVRDWRDAVGDRVKFLLSEVGEADSSYLVRELAAHLGDALPQNLDVGAVHSHKSDLGYIDTVGPEWDGYVSLVKSSLGAVCKHMRDEHHGLFGSEAVAKWWPCSA